MKELNLHFERQLPDEPAAVYQLARNHFPELLKPIPIIDLAEEQRHGDSVIHVERRWLIDLVQALPGFISSWLSLGQIEATEVSHWSDPERKVGFSISAPNHNDVLRSCSGRVDVLKADRGTRASIEVQASVEIAALPGMPGFVASRLEPRLEGAVRSILGRKIDRIVQEIDERL